MAGTQRKRKTARVPSGDLSAWERLRDLFEIPDKRPADSITAAEMAILTGLSVVHCGAVLRRKVREGKMRVIEYHAETGRRAKCYVRAQ